MKKKSKPKKSSVNKFCGERDCNLGFVHWHWHDPDSFRSFIGVQAPTREEPVEFSAVSKEWQPFPVGSTEAAIAKGLLDMPCCSDPDATRFKGKTAEEIKSIQRSEIPSTKPAEDKPAVEVQIEILREHMDTALKNLSAGFDHLASGDLARMHADIREQLNAISENHQAMRQAVAAWRAADEIRHEEIGKAGALHHNKMVSLLMELGYRTEQQPGFWTAVWASICGDAVLISSCVIVASLIILIIRYT